MSIIDGKLIANQITENLKQEIAKNNLSPKLAIILIGSHTANEIYVKAKISKAKEIGIEAELIRLESDVSEDELLEKIEDLNNDSSIHAIIVQLPIPAHINLALIQSSIDPAKDVDAFNPFNVGMLYSGFDPYFLPPTPMGCFHLIKSVSDEVIGKNIVIVGKSNIVGKPLASLLLREQATVTLCHSHTNNLADITKKADIVILATGASEFFTEEYFSEGQIVIDVGISKNSEGKIVGDVDFANVSKKVAHITPVPGGSGPMTIAYLMSNCVVASYDR